MFLERRAMYFKLSNRECKTFPFSHVIRVMENRQYIIVIHGAQV
jgi:hypothetical protein